MKENVPKIGVKAPEFSVLNSEGKEIEIKKVLCM